MLLERSNTGKDLTALAVEQPRALARGLGRRHAHLAQLHRLARQCDEHRANVFYCHVMENHSADQLFFLDETSKDNRALNRCAVLPGSPASRARDL